MASDQEVKRFEENFSIIRKAVGWSAAEFGDRCGVTRQTINNIENKKYSLTKAKNTYLAMRFVLNEEMAAHPKETEMLKDILDALVDNPEKFSKEELDTIRSKADFYSSAIKPRESNAKRIMASIEWKNVMKAACIITASLSAIAVTLIKTQKTK